MAISGDAVTSLQLADEAISKGDIDGAVVHLSAAVRSFTAAGANRAAAMACARLGDLFQNRVGNKVAARPWFIRAIRLVEDDEPCIEQGWVAIAPMGCDVDDPAVLLERGALALDRARRFGDIDLEVKALADAGLAYVQLGQVAEGMAMIDEAMALACTGLTGDAGVVGKSVCSFYTACYYTADLERVESWTNAFNRHGILGPAPGSQAFLSHHCDSVRATLLCHVGRWSEAERILVRAQATIDEAMPGAAWHTPIALAELRILQGRLEEAEVLLLGRDDQVQALLPTARLHLARGDFDLARATAQRGLRVMANDRVRAATLFGVLVEAGLGGGDLAQATDALAELETRVDGLDLRAPRGEAARLRALVHAVEGNTAAAVESAHRGLDELGGGDLPLLRIALHLQVARLLEGSDHARAVTEARAAAAILARVDVVVAAPDAALLDRLGAARGAASPAAGCRVATLQRTGTWWTAGCGNTKVRLRETLGLRYLAELVAHPGVERPALVLVDLVEGVSLEGIDRRKLGDAGAFADSNALAAYRRRVAELRDQVEDALAVEDDERAARSQAELDVLLAELARAFGLGGRDRRASSAAEKARLNVTRALRSTLAKLTDALPEAGAILDRRVRTGSYCAYEPHPDDTVTWSVQPWLNKTGAS